MKRLLVILALLTFQASVFAQTPYSFNYQAVVRDTDGNVLTDKVVDFTIDIILNGQAVYSETHTGIDTGTNGIVNFKIGEGTATSGTFTDIDWGAGAYKIRVTMDGELLGISNVTAVPIALYAVKSMDNPWEYSSSDNSLSYTKGLTEVQDLKINGSSDLSPEAGMIRYDVSSNDFIGYNGSEWKSLTESTATTESSSSLWSLNTDNNSISYTNGLTELKDLKIYGSSNLSPEAGMIRFSADSNDFEGYNGTEWKSLTTTATNTTTTVIDTLWTVDATSKSITYDEGATKVKDLIISGSSDAAAEEGMIRFDSTTKDFVGYNGTEWKSMIASAGTETTVVDTLWALDTEDKSISYTDGLTKLKELSLSGNNDTVSTEGMIRYDADNKDFLGYNGTEWKSLTTEASSTTTGDYISTEAELKTAIENQVSDIVIDADFEITSPITISYSLRLESLGAAKTISTKGTNAITINASNVTIENILFASSGGGIAISIESGLTDVKLSDLSISAFERAIYKNGSAGSTQTSRLSFNNIKVLDSVNSGSTSAICVLGNVEDLVMDQIVVDGTSGRAITIQYACSGQLDNIKINDGQSDGLTLLENTTSSVPSRMISLSNININTTTGKGIVISQSAATIANATITAATGSAIDITGSTSDFNPPVTLSNLNISGTKVSGTNSYGITLKDDATATISNFYITGTSTASVDDQAIGVYALDSQNFIVNGGIFMKLGKLISVETSN